MPGANWSLPTTADLRTAVLGFLNGKDFDAVSHFYSGDGTNMPTGALKFLRASNKWQEWNGAAWVDVILGLAGGGTGASTAAAARTSLGLTSLATQDPLAVNIKGIVEIKGGNLTFDTDGTRNIGADAIRPNQIWVKNALVIPVGSNKYAT